MTTRTRYLLLALLTLAAGITWPLLTAAPASAHQVPPSTCYQVASLYPQPTAQRVRTTCLRLVAHHALVHRCMAMPSGMGAGVCDALAGSSRPTWATNAALHELLRRESTWSTQAVNDASGACGLFQRLPCPWKYATAPDTVWSTPAQQVRNGVAYVISRYGTPEHALKHHDEAGWY